MSAFYGPLMFKVAAGHALGNGVLMVFAPNFMLEALTGSAAFTELNVALLRVAGIVICALGAFYYVYSENPRQYRKMIAITAVAKCCMAAYLLTCGSLSAAGRMAGIPDAILGGLYFMNLMQ